MADIDPASCRAARAALNMSQRDLARQAGIGLSAVVDFENGNRTPRPISRRAIRSALEAAGAFFCVKADGSIWVSVRPAQEPQSEGQP
jgi:transcriptional regulator with XRE-family HTH domain